ncbi:hypothetical protein IFR04_010190 [Cadophora malorum]|uniref:Mid2 domain-containing protein n=1 Tax=Cadophora malorum TaxID=108018 RepID=A0A8H7TCK7_9HELO|nr:hypothetical protein IFR04_010190 [Cadophora malorum]
MPGAATEPPITPTTKPPVVTGPTSTPTPTTTTTPPPIDVETTVPVSDSNPGKSKAFIAGVVVGPVAALAIIGLLVWVFFLKRSKRKDQTAQQYQTQQQMAPAPQQYQQPPPQDPRYSAAPTYSNVSYQGSYQQPTVYSPGASTMSSPQMPYTENVAGTQHHGPEGYFSPDSKTPAVTTSQQTPGSPPPAAPYNYPPHSELQ